MGAPVWIASNSQSLKTGVNILVATGRQDCDKVTFDFPDRRLTFATVGLAALAVLAAGAHQLWPNIWYLVGIWEDTTLESLVLLQNEYGSVTGMINTATADVFRVRTQQVNFTGSFYDTAFLHINAFWRKIVHRP